MWLCECSKEEIDLQMSNSYSSMVIKELLDNCDLAELNFIPELNKKDKNRVIKIMKKYIKDNEKEIKKQEKLIGDLKELLTEEE